MNPATSFNSLNPEEIEQNFMELVLGLPKESVIYINSSGVRESFLDAIQKNTNIKAQIEVFNAEAEDIYGINRNITAKGLEGIVSESKVRESLKNYKGVKRRYDTIFDNESFRVISWSHTSI